jgi:hypothetical protein
MRAPHALLFAATAALSASAARAEDDPLDVRLIYDDTPGIARIQRDHSSSTAGTAYPAGDGTIHPHAQRGYAIGAGVAIGLPIDADDGLDGLIGADLSDGIARGDLPAGGAPGGATAAREDLDAFALRLRGGASWRIGDFRFEAAPFAAIGVARATFEGTQAPSGSGGASGLLALFGVSGQVRSGPGLYYAYGAEAGAYYAPLEAGELTVGAHVGYESFHARVAIEPNDFTGGATDRISGAGLLVGASLGTRF